jgi:hypothetical protein
MKTTFVVLAMFVLCSAAFGQISGSATAVQQLQIGENPQHADYHPMGTEQSLLGGNNVTYAHGELPLWEFGPVSQPVPLGDVARAYRKEKLTAKKAEIIFEKQGYIGQGQ